MDLINNFFANLSNFLWGNFGVANLVIGGGIFFLLYSRLTPFRYFKHAFHIVLGKYDDPDDDGQISHFQALSTALSSTVGIGNIAGVAVAISLGGPGALFWMWISAIVGMATKFFTCSLGIMFRGHDSDGELQGGPMYVIEQGMGKKFKFLSYWFSIAGLVGCLSLLQVNQLTQILSDQLIKTNPNIATAIPLDLTIGIIIALIVSVVIFGGLQRIADVASKVVPFMVLVYLSAGLFIVFSNIALVPSIFNLIFTSAFNGSSVAGGFVGTAVVISQGFRRAAFSNEAGMGTEVMAIGASKNNEPIRSGLVAMIGPVIDTLIVCTITGIVILLSGDWMTGEFSGVTLTQKSFANHLGVVGDFILIFSVATFALSTMFGYSYYGCKCASYLFGTGSKIYYRIFYVITLVLGSILSLDLAVNIVDAMFALMAFPTMISAIYLSPHIKKEAKRYFDSI
ncbi:MAG: alanine:cation symporter family protein [Candidatus Marinimicrobia bacterium]|jgi:AGCS family alanine or glycine:cation symporter|nr:alanine:cation symporter family protein [Candidatus Neomarinimicrobiota bacterium]MBT4111633.1 alanine:cation symporter family protein [Candidatus Neomarinimicrobiota bacterium]MBT4316682.1 alanine:cation symporter family protein [Candidatus Neomarinimicrobiota bacterium]MBT4707148.1 alanine:cation symporter family protein [Candidatus Neomarinimicrobiota bacterium]MBT4925702.1 alanine:cation symporter family protein [Candidatus Neomarinimicrobiota bacterium]